MARVENLLSLEGVKFDATDLRITSTRTSIAVLGIQPKLYTRLNWVGLNPFSFVTAVDVRFEPDVGVAGTRVNVRINRRRSILWAASWTLCGYLAGRAMPQPAGALVFVAVFIMAWLGIVSFLGGYLVRKEIVDATSPRFQ